MQWHKFDPEIKHLSLSDIIKLLVSPSQFTLHFTDSISDTDLEKQ